MTKPIVYDKAKYHYDGEFPSDLDMEQGFVHTGMFLGWLIDRDLYSEWFGKELSGYIVSFKKRELTGAQVFEACDGVFMDTMLNDEGNEFAQHYFDFEHGSYLKDYAELFARDLPSIYHVQDSWDNYAKLKKRIDKRYWKWQAERAGGWRALVAKFL